MNNERLKTMSREELVDHFEFYCSDSGETQASIARAIGVTGSLLSAWKGGTYPGNMKKVTRSIAQYLYTRYRQKEETTLDFPYVETKQAMDINSVVNFCMVHRKMGLVHGPSGLGKTTALQNIARENSQVIYVMAYSKINQQDILAEILYAMNRPLKRISKAKMLRQLRFELQGSTKVIAVDEAQKCRLDVLETLRHLWDSTGVGVVFVGTDDVIDRMKGRGQMEYDQIYSRLAIKVRLKRVANDDVKNILVAAGVEHDGNGLFKAAQEIAAKQGHFRTLMNHLQMAYEIARESGREKLKGNDMKQAGHMLWRED